MIWRWEIAANFLKCNVSRNLGISTAQGFNEFHILNSECFYCLEFYLLVVAFGRFEICWMEAWLQSSRICRAPWFVGNLWKLHLWMGLSNINSMEFKESMDSNQVRTMVLNWFLEIWKPLVIGLKLREIRNQELWFND